MEAAPGAIPAQTQRARAYADGRFWVSLKWWTRNQSILCPRAQIASLTVMADSPASPGRSARSRSVCSAVVDQPTASSVRAFSVSTPAEIAARRQ